jgi:hypothetical protein
MESINEIVILNLSTEIVKNVKLFNFDFNKQSKIQYSCGASAITYESYLAALIGTNKPIYKIETIKIKAKATVFQWYEKQIKTKLSAIINNTNGYVVTVEYKPYKPVVMGKDYAEFEYEEIEIPLSNKVQIQLDYIMPLTKVTVTFKMKTL